MADEHFPYLARQLNGDIASSIGKGIDYVYKKDAEEEIDKLLGVSINSLSGEDLDNLGIVLGSPRQKLSPPGNVFLFDSSITSILEGDVHGFSDVNDESLGGGVLADANSTDDTTPLSDAVYRIYLKAFCAMKASRSIESICDALGILVADSDVNSGEDAESLYAVEFVNKDNISQYTSGSIGDIIIKIKYSLYDYKNALQVGFDKIFSTSPKVLIVLDENFEEEYEG